MRDKRPRKKSEEDLVTIKANIIAVNQMVKRLIWEVLLQQFLFCIKRLPIPAKQQTNHPQEYMYQIMIHSGVGTVQKVGGGLKLIIYKWVW